MAIIENGANGGFTGKAGSVTGYYANGKWIIRGLRKLSAKNKKGTVKQQAARARFAKMQAFLAPIIYFIRIGFNLESKKRMMTAHNVAKSYNMLNAQEADGTILYSNVCVSFGHLIGVEGLDVQAANNALQFSWTDNSNADHTRSLDQVMLLAYDVDNNITHVEVGGAKRNKCAETLVIPGLNAGANYHAWISFISNDRLQISRSTYCGLYSF
jgi:hypothetical protein